MIKPDSILLRLSHHHLFLLQSLFLLLSVEVRHCNHLLLLHLLSKKERGGGDGEGKGSERKLPRSSALLSILPIFILLLIIFKFFSLALGSLCQKLQYMYIITINILQKCKTVKILIVKMIDDG